MNLNCILLCRCMDEKVGTVELRRSNLQRCDSSDEIYKSHGQKGSVVKMFGCGKLWKENC